MTNFSPRLVTRRNFQSRWIWELLSHDRHVLNRSDSDFATKKECEAHAVANGQTLEALTKRERQETDPDPDFV